MILPYSIIKVRRLIYHDYVYRYMLAKSKFIQSFYRKQEIDLAKFIVEKLRK